MAFRKCFLLVFILVLAACQSDNSTSTRGKLFLVQVSNETFTMFVTDPATIQLAIDNFDGKNARHPSGKIALGHGGFNGHHSWHYIPETVEMVEVSMELCDGLPSYVDDHANDFLASGYCPWNGRILRVGS